MNVKRVKSILADFDRQNRYVKLEHRPDQWLRVRGLGTKRVLVWDRSPVHYPLDRVIAAK
jgi:hypothetical protein